MKLRYGMSGQFRSGGGGGIQTVGYSGAHTFGSRVGVGVTVAARVGVAVRVAVGVDVCVGVLVGVLVAVGVRVTVAVPLGVRVTVAVPLGVISGPPPGVLVGVVVVPFPLCATSGT